MRKYIVMGVQGSGKGTHAKLLAETLDLEPISVGDIFRWNVQHHTKLGAQVRRSVAAGELVSDDLVAAVVHRRLGEHDWNYGFIIDGFPRNQPQARFFLESYDLDAVILLEVPDQVVTERILSRWPKCRRLSASTWVSSWHPPNLIVRIRFVNLGRYTSPQARRRFRPPSASQGSGRRPRPSGTAPILACTTSSDADPPTEGGSGQ